MLLTFSGLLLKSLWKHLGSLQLALCIHENMDDAKGCHQFQQQVPWTVAFVASKCLDG
jgi:hypothetical protein